MPNHQFYVLVPFTCCHHTDTPTLNAIQPSNRSPEAAARRARNIDRLERLTDIAMQLAERAGARALAETTEPEPQPPTEPKPNRTAPRINQDLVFKTLARLVKDLVTITSRLDAGLVPDAPAPDAPSDAWQTLTDPRRQHIIRIVHEAIKTSPHPKSEHKALRHQVESRTFEFLAADPDQTLPAAVAIITLCQELKLPYDIHQFDDEVLLPPGGTMPTAAPEPIDDLSRISGVRHPP